MKTTLRLTQTDYDSVKLHLFPGDGLEAIAVALCGRRRSHSTPGLMVRKIVPIPHDQCSVRSADRVTWSTALLVPLLEEAAREDLAILKIHSHPTGHACFSPVDDQSDKDLFASIFGWTDSAFPHASAVMLPDGRMFGRASMRDGTFQTLGSILIPGDDIQFWDSDELVRVAAFAERHAQLFGTDTTRRLHRMAAAVIGCSGTGSPLIEQLARLGFGRLVLVDPDFIEERNLNRIVNSSREQAYLKRPKVEAMARAIALMGFGTEVEIVHANLATPEAVKAVATCDVVFGCMDGVEGRHLLNRLAAYYVLPYFDVGVKLEADGKGGISEACGAVHYLRPEKSTLLDRGVYTHSQLKAAGLRRTDPVAYQDQVRAGYIHGVAEDRPAVISINMHMASLAVNEFLARLHPYRYDANADSAIVRTSFIHPGEYREREPIASGMFGRHIGEADIDPLLSMPELSELGANA